MHEWNELRNGYGGIPKEGPVSDELARILIHGYYACVSYTDKLIGDLLDELERLEIDEDTIVILVGDHGWQLGEHTFGASMPCLKPHCIHHDYQGAGIRRSAHEGAG